MRGEVVYHVDGQDVVRCVNREYDEFALANQGHAVSSATVVGRPLWDFVHDPTTRQIYRAILDRARDGRPVAFTFRCDSPERRRLLRMSVRATGGGDVEFRVNTIAIQDRPPERLLSIDASRSEVVLTACGWCKKIRLEHGWSEIEDAVAALGLFEATVLPSLTHGICEACRDEMLALVAHEV